MHTGKLRPLKHWKSLDRNALFSWGLLLLIPLSNLNIHTYLPIPPSLLGLLGALLLSVRLFDPACSDRPERLHSDHRQFYLFSGGLIIYLFLSQYVLVAPFGRYMGLISALAFLPLTLIFLGQQKVEQAHIWPERFIRWAIAILIIECIWRFAMSLYQIQQGHMHTYGIYRFKTYGLMYSESNTTALHILMVLIFSFLWGDIRKQSLAKEKIILGILLFLTFSRAGILAAALGIGFYYLSRTWRYKTLLIGCAAVMGSLFLVSAIFFWVDAVKDYSFLSKFYILFQAERYFDNATWHEWLFGVGSSLSESRLGIYSHLFFLTYLIETGLVGLLGIVMLFVVFIVHTRRNGLVFLLPFCVMTLSSSTTYIPFFYAAMAMVIWFSKKPKAIQA